MKLSTLNRRMRLLQVGENAKTVKSDKLGDYLTAIMYLAPADLAKGINVCPMAETAKCKAPCLNLAGNGMYPNVQAARLKKTELFRDDRARFLRLLHVDIALFVAYCAEHRRKPAIRLNGTSDIAWEKYGVPQFWPTVQFYDYTKILGRVGKVPSNYHLTVSYSGANPKYAAAVKRLHRRTGVNVTVVYKVGDWKGSAIRLPVNVEFPESGVVDGDQHDMTFAYPPGTVIALSAKGKANTDTSGFVVG